MIFTLFSCHFLELKEGHPVKPIMEIAITAPIHSKVAASFCSMKCQDRGQNVEVTFATGLPNMSGEMTLNAGFYQNTLNLFSINVDEVISR